MAKKQPMVGRKPENDTDGGITDRLEIAELRRQVVELRTFEGQAIDFKGTFDDPKAILLLPSWAILNSRKTPS